MGEENGELISEKVEKKRRDVLRPEKKSGDPRNGSCTIKDPACSRGKGGCSKDEKGTSTGEGENSVE